MHDNTHNFSFSGLKTAVMREWDKTPKTEADGSAFSYEVQEAITDILVRKTLAAVEEYQAQSVLVAGGVSANTRLRNKMNEYLNTEFPGVSLHVPPVRFCTDNAAYIGAYAFFRGSPTDWRTLRATPNLSVEVAS